MGIWMVLKTDGLWLWLQCLGFLCMQQRPQL